MKHILLLAALMLILNLSAQSQVCVGCTETEVLSIIKRQNVASGPHKSLADDGTPYIYYEAIDEKTTIGYYFSGGRCFEYRVVAPEYFRTNWVRSIENAGYYYEDGYWYNSDGKTYAKVTVESPFIMLQILSWK